MGFGRLTNVGIWDGQFGEVEVRRVQPYEALKVYVCPGCNRDIPEGMGHYVCVPRDAADFCASLKRVAFTAATGFAALFLATALFWK